MEEKRRKARSEARFRAVLVSLLALVCVYVLYRQIGPQWTGSQTDAEIPTIAQGGRQ